MKDQVNEQRIEKPILISLLGAPGSGKSTFAAKLFSALKENGVSCEFVTEFVKEKVYEENKTVFNDQFFVLANQAYKLNTVSKCVDVIVQDGSILLSKLYYKEGYISYETFEKCVDEIDKSYYNIRLYAESFDEYQENGRIHTREESRELEELIKQKFNFDYTVVEVKENLDSFVEFVKTLVRSKYE